MIVSTAIAAMNFQSVAFGEGGGWDSALSTQHSALSFHQYPISLENITSYTLRAQLLFPNSTLPSCFSHSLMGSVNPVLRRVRTSVGSGGCGALARMPLPRPLRVTS